MDQQPTAMFGKSALLVLAICTTMCYALTENDIIQSPTASASLNEDLSSSNRQGREYYSSSYYEDDKGKFNGYPDYAPGNNYIPYKEEAAPPANCPPSPLAPLLSNGLNFLLLKLGAIGLIKSFLAVVFVIFLFKLPIFLAKAAIVKAIILPAFVAPLMMLFSNAMGNNMMQGMMPDKNKPQNDNNNNNNNNNNDGQGRALDDILGSAAWQSVRFLMDSDKCAERMACQVGTVNNDTVSGATLARMARYIEQSSPSNTKYRIRSIREAFIEGNEGGECTSVNYPCETPHLFVSQGSANFKVL